MQHDINFNLERGRDSKVWLDVVFVIVSTNWGKTIILLCNNEQKHVVKSDA